MPRKVIKIQPLIAKIPNKKRVAAYARVSTSKETMIHSLSAQVSYYSEFIQKNKSWKYVGVYADEALTGTKEQRPELQRLLKDCRSGKIDMVITKSISRLARNTVTMLEAVRELKELNVDVYFEKENIHSLSGDGELMLTILASFAQEESRSVSENCKWRIRNNFKDGIPNTFQVYGYNIYKGKMQINPKEAKVVIMIFNAYLEGMGRLAIAKKLNSMDIRTRNNKQWDSSKIKEILNNEKYAGDLLLQKKYIADHLEKKTCLNDGRLPKYYVSNNHDAIIDRDTFNEVQEEIEKRKKKYKVGRTTTNKYPFTGMIRCGKCGKYYHRKINNAGTKYQKEVWICSTYNSFGKEKCSSKQIPENILISLAAEVLGLKQFDEGIFKNKIKEIQVLKKNLVMFIFNDGAKVKKEWSYK
ncbi:recombinase family protein [Clostridium cochlearium]|uniref:recombinase family protein n=1 Tax=Clostridium cochlearium TaxID=1494 RepID=UPI0022E402E4|nr:recombinase family protein [Clostridium cochlearium]